MSSGIIPTMAIVAVQPAGQGGKGLTSPQLNLGNLTPGQMLEGVVLGKDGGTLQLQTPLGIIMLRAVPEIARLLIQGDRVQLKLDNQNQHSSAKLVGVNGKPIEEIKNLLQQEKPATDTVVHKENEPATPVTYGAKGALRASVATTVTSSQPNVTPTTTVKATLTAATQQQQEALQKIIPPSIQQQSTQQVKIGMPFLLRLAISVQPEIQSQNIKAATPQSQPQPQIVNTTSPAQAQPSPTPAGQAPITQQPLQQQSATQPQNPSGLLNSPQAQSVTQHTLQVQPSIPQNTSPTQQPQQKSTPQPQSQPAFIQDSSKPNILPSSIITTTAQTLVRSEPPAGFVYGQIIISTTPPEPQQQTTSQQPQPQQQHVATQQTQPPAGLQHGQPTQQPQQTTAQTPTLQTSQISTPQPTQQIPAGQPEQPAQQQPPSQTLAAAPTQPQIKPQIFIQTPFGIFHLPPNIQLSQNSGTVAVQIQPFTETAETTDSSTAQAGKTSWPALEETKNILQRAGAMSGEYASSRIPPLGPKTMAAAIMFMNALSLSDPRSWLGDKLLHNLEIHGRGHLAERLQLDFSQLQQLWQKSDNENWQSTILPFMNGDKLDFAKLMVKSHHPSAGGEMGSTRFIIEVELSHFGPMQFDGFYKYWVSQSGGRENRKFDLHIRSHRELEEEVSAEMASLFNNALQLTGISGQIGMQAINPFPSMPEEESLNRTIQSVMSEK